MASPQRMPIMPFMISVLSACNQMEQTLKQTVEWLVNRDELTVMWRQSFVFRRSQGCHQCGREWQRSCCVIIYILLDQDSHGCYLHLDLVLCWIELSLSGCLTHWPMGDMVMFYMCNLLTYAVQENISWTLLSAECHRINLMICQHRFRWWLAVIQQANTRTNDDLDLWADEYWLKDALWRHRSALTLGHVICLTAPNYYLNQC